MPYQFQDLNCYVCQPVITALGNRFGCNPNATQRPHGLLEFVTSPFNRAGIQDIVEQFDSRGKLVPDITLVFNPRLLPEDVVLGGDGCEVFCTSDNKVGETCVTKTIDPCADYLSTSWTIEYEDFRSWCGDDTAHIAAHLGLHMNQLRWAINRRLWALLEAELADAVYYGSTAPGEKFCIENACTDCAGAQGALNKLTSQVMMDEFCAAPSLIGGKNLFDLLKIADAANCCTDSGINLEQLSSQNPYNFLFDKDVHEVPFGDAANPDFAILDQGAFQIVTWNKNRGIHAYQTDTKFHTTIADPRFPGIVYDYTGKLDDCTNKWSFQLGVAVSACCRPNQFQDADPNAGLTGKFTGCITPA